MYPQIYEYTFIGNFGYLVQFTNSKFIPCLQEILTNFIFSLFKFERMIPYTYTVLVVLVSIKHILRESKKLYVKNNKIYY